MIYLTQYNYISKYEPTHYYIKFAEPYMYGVCININDIARKDEIIEKLINDNRASAQAHLKNLLESKYYNRLMQQDKNNGTDYIEFMKNGGSTSKWVISKLQTLTLQK